MRSIVLESSTLIATILPDLGAGLADLSVRGPDGSWYPLLRRAHPAASHFNDLAMYLLAPWSNRIARAKFRFGGREVRLTPDWPDGTAIHGAVKDKPFAILDRSPVSARLAFQSRGSPDANWPWPFTCTIKYEIDDDCLDCDLAVRNDGDTPMPAGVGFHPFFNRTLWDEDDRVGVHADVALRYPLRRCLPVGPPKADALCRSFRATRKIRGLALDDAFKRSAPRPRSRLSDTATVIYGASRAVLTLNASPNLGHTVIYSPRTTYKKFRPYESDGPGTPPYFCLEPVSMVNDGFNLLHRGEEGTGVVVLNPGEQLHARMTITFMRYDRPPHRR